MPRNKWQHSPEQLQLPLFPVAHQRPQLGKKLAAPSLKKAQLSMPNRRYFTTAEALEHLGLSITENKQLYFSTRNEMYKARARGEEFLYDQYRVRPMKKPDGHYWQNRWQIFQEVIPDRDAA